MSFQSPSFCIFKSFQGQTAAVLGTQLLEAVSRVYLQAMDCRWGQSCGLSTYVCHSYLFSRSQTKLRYDIGDMARFTEATLGALLLPVSGILYFSNMAHRWTRLSRSASCLLQLSLAEQSSAAQDFWSCIALQP